MAENALPPLEKISRYDTIRSSQPDSVMATQGLLVPYFEVRVLIGLLFPNTKRSETFFKSRFRQNEVRYFFHKSDPHYRWRDCRHRDYGRLYLLRDSVWIKIA